MRQAGQRQLRNLRNIGVNETPAAAQCEYGTTIRRRKTSRFSTGTKRAAFHDDLRAFRAVVFALGGLHHQYVRI